MRRWLLWFTVPAILGGLFVAQAEDNATARFLGPETGWSACHLELHDVHGLWGGTAVYVEGSGRCAVESVDRGQHERRFTLKLDPQEVTDLLRLCIASDLVGLRIKDRPGVPDEARPTIVLLEPSGRAHAVAKWSNDKVPGFDRVYAALRGLEKKTADQKPEFEGPFAWDWRPWEAVVVTLSMFSGRPDPSFELTAPAEWERVRDGLKDLPAASKPNPPQLGYRGVVIVPRLVPGLPARATAWQGTVGIERAGGAVTWHEDARGVEAWLLGEAKRRGLPAPR